VIREFWYLNVQVDVYVSRQTLAIQLKKRAIKIILEEPRFESFVLHQHYIIFLHKRGKREFLPHHEYIKSKCESRICGFKRIARILRLQIDYWKI